MSRKVDQWTLLKQAEIYSQTIKDLSGIIQNDMREHLNEEELDQLVLTHKTEVKKLIQAIALWAVGIEDFYGAGRASSDSDEDTTNQESD